MPWPVPSSFAAPLLVPQVGPPRGSFGGTTYPSSPTPPSHGAPAAARPSPCRATSHRPPRRVPRQVSKLVSECKAAGRLSPRPVPWRLDVVRLLYTYYFLRTLASYCAQLGSLSSPKTPSHRRTCCAPAPAPLESPAASGLQATGTTAAATGLVPNNSSKPKPDAARLSRAGRGGGAVEAPRPRCSQRKRSTAARLVGVRLRVRLRARARAKVRARARAS